jgi:hypothetical protein
MMIGSPARDYLEQRRIFAAEPKLPELIRKVAELEKKLS